MKNVWIALFPFLIGAIFTVGCNNTDDKPVNSGLENEVFMQEPALRTVTQEIAKSPDNAALYYDRGVILQKLRQDSLAIKDFKKASSLDTNNASYYSAVGDILFESKDLNGAIDWIQKAIEKQPDDRKAHLKIAKLFLYLQDYGKAFAEINIVLRKNVYDPEAYFLKGMIYKDMKDTAKSISNFLTSVQVAPDYRDAVVQLGIMYSAQKNPIALQYLQNAYDMDTTNVFPVFAKGVFYQDNNDFARAKEAYRKCILADRQYTDAYFNMGYILMQEDSTQKSWRQYNMAIRTDPTNPAAYFNRGLCSEMMDSIGNAIADYKMALKLDKNYDKPKEALTRLRVKL